MHSMDWDDLRFVLALARKGSLSQAAISMGVTHTTVGRRLRSLEDGLKVRLFDRTPDGFVLTASGADLVQVAEGTERELHALQSRLLGRDVQLSGDLRVAAMDIMLPRYREVLRDFMTSHPSVNLTLTMSDIEVSLTRRQADVAFRMTNSPPEHLVGRRVHRVEFAVYGHRELVAAVGPAPRYEDFPWIHWDERLNMTWLDHWLAQHAPGAHVALRLDAPAWVIQEAIGSGYGVHFLATVDGDADPRLERIGPIHPQFGRDIWLLTLQELRHQRRVRAFMDHVYGALKAGAATA